MLPQLKKFKGVALDLLFPQKCVGCGEEGSLICAACQKSLPGISPPICPKCGRPQASGLLCPGCTSWHSSIDGIRSPLKFEGVVREAIHQLKYKNLRSLAKPLTVFLYNCWRDQSIPGEVLVPVPLHPKRLKERGYNQSALLSRELGRLCGLPFNDSCLRRTRYILPQARTQSVEERRENVKEAFVCTGDLKDKEVLLIDDVSTSGSTLDACAAALKNSGAKSVYGLVLAREI